MGESEYIPDGEGLVVLFLSCGRSEMQWLTDAMARVYDDIADGWYDLSGLFQACLSRAEPVLPSHITRSTRVELLNRNEKHRVFSEMLVTIRGGWARWNGGAS